MLALNNTVTELGQTCLLILAFCACYRVLSCFVHTFHLYRGHNVSSVTFMSGLADQTTNPPRSICSFM